MSLLDLNTLISKEDFADAHEPLNDGIKKVPNAQTVAAGTKPVGKDTTTAGPAKVIPEKKDTDDVESKSSKPEHSVVKESAEKGGDKSTAPAKSDSSESKPVAKPFPPKSADSDKSDSTDKDSGSGDDDKPSPAKPKAADEATDAAEDEEPLVHETEKDTKSDLEKTDKATKSLEAYLPKARRFDIIGYPKAQVEQVTNMVKALNRRGGITTPVTLSFESINAAVEIGKQHTAKLERNLERFKATHSNESIDETVIVDEVPVEQPTTSGGELLPAAVADGITEYETDPLDVPLLEIEKVRETVDALQQSNAAIEQYIQIIRSTPRMSKQAAAVLHAGLEHIDRVCELRVRATGMEGYVTTPRAAMEEAAVDEKSLLDRAGEIGAKILKWIKVMVAKAVEAWERYQVGLDKLKENMVELKKSKFKTEGEIVLRPAPAELFTEGLFTGDWLTPEEERLPSKLASYYTELTREITRRCRALLGNKSAEDIELVMEALKKEDKVFSLLPGPHKIASEAGRLHLVDSDAEQPEEHKVDISEAKPALLLESMIKSLEKLSNLDVVNQLKKASDEVTQGLVKYRKGAGKELDETAFQKLQQVVVDNSIKLFDIEAYFDILKYVGRIYNARYKLCAKMVAA